MALISSTEAVARSGATFRQLDYWAKTGVVSPQRPAVGSGSSRGWSESQVAALARLAALSGLLGQLRRAVADAGSEPAVVEGGGMRITVEAIMGAGAQPDLPRTRRVLDRTPAPTPIVSRSAARRLVVHPEQECYPGAELA